jgi:hypothetical protein
LDGPSRAPRKCTVRAFPRRAPTIIRTTGITIDVFINYAIDTKDRCQRYLWSKSDELEHVHDDAQRLVRRVCEVEQICNPLIDLGIIHPVWTHPYLVG